MAFGLVLPALSNVSLLQHLLKVNKVHLVTFWEICLSMYLLKFFISHQSSPSATLAFLKKIYDGQEIDVSLPLALTRLPTYTQKVLKATSRIPLGYVASYGSIAQAVGGGPRAVGNVMASNPFAPIVPCHRVVKSDFTLGGYGGGLKVKLEFLTREKKGFSSSKEVEVNGRLLQVFPVEYTLGLFS